ncbi:MAG TPA: alpha-hydroxy acid oxidase, partial [Beijerinckiaceae bacterium]
AEAAGCRALVVTVDAPVSGLRNAEQRVGFRLPPGVEAANLPPGRARGPAWGGHPIFDGLLAGAATWREIDRLKKITRLPLVLKGVLSPDDARQALDCGVDGLIVSNHGGRTLDTLEASLDALPRIADVVGGAAPLLLDGGVRRGTDVLKALALGARAVLIGRAYAFALAAAGPIGVAHAVKVLVDEFCVAMALTGCRTVADIGPWVLRR